MPIQVEYEGVIHEFPDDFTDADIQAALSQSQTSPKTLGGFAENVVTSGGRFLKDTASGVLGLAQTANRVGRAMFNPTEAQALAQDVATIGKQSPAIINHMGQAVKDRYGSPTAIANTLYEDPVGALADISTVAGGVGGAAKLSGRLPRVASAALKVERVTNPLTLPGIIAKPVASHVSDVAIGATVRPSSALRKEAGGRQNIINAIREHRTITPEHATKAANQAHDAVKTKIAAAPHSPIPVKTIIDDVELRSRAADAFDNRARLGLGEDTDSLQSRLNRFWEEAGGELAHDEEQVLRIGDPAPVPLEAAQDMKREAQRMAYEHGVRNESAPRLTNEAFAKSLKGRIEERVPDIKELNRRSQSAMWAERALSEAADKNPSFTSRVLSAGGGGYLAQLLGLPPWAGAIVGAAAQSPRAGISAGLAVDDLGHILANPQIQRALLAARASGVKVDEDLLMELLKRQIVPVASH